MALAQEELAARAQTAPAKVNLALHVTGQRADGYHLLDSLVAFTETAFDAVTVTFGEADEVAFSASGPFAADVPAENSVVAAARAVGGICAVALEKGLPVASGLGGGSADAAAVLRAAVTVGRLAEADALALAARLGADVPVCFAGRACRMGGIGEVLAPLSVPRVPAVIANPLVPVSTAAVFARLAHKENNAMDVRRLSSVDAVAAFLGETRNDLMAPAMAEAPIIADVLEALREAPSCLGARMSGSGASVFGLFADDDAAARAAAALAGRGWWVKATAFAGAL